MDVRPFAAIAMLGLTAASPSAAPPDAPVSAMTCRGGVTSIELTEHAAYDATFVNTARVAADDIHVTIPYGRRRVAAFNVAQPFPPGTPVAVHLHKNLAGGLYAYESSENTCRVRYVHFVDGTSWGDPQARN